MSDSDSEIYYRQTDCASENFFVAIDPDRGEAAPRPPGDWEMTRAEFLKSIAAGGLAVLVSSALPAALLGDAQTEPAEINAWVRIDAENRITAFSPKVEYGQGIRMGFAMVVAEELEVDVDRIDVVVGDTGRVPPENGGTWGSGSTIYVYPRLRRAAALAREALLNLGAEQLEINKNKLELHEGRVFAPDRPWKAATYGELAGGPIPASAVPEEADFSPAEANEYIGQTKAKPDVPAKVMGDQVFATDINLDDMAYGAVLRAGPNNRLDRFDDQQAINKQGVLDVVRTEEFLVVVAERTDLARKAIREQAAPPRAGPDLDSDKLRAYIENNARSRRTVEQSGRLEQGLRRADETIEVSYFLPYVQHTPIETETATARWDGEQLTIWTGAQAPFRVQQRIARYYGLPDDAVRIIVPDTGGAFGGKGQHSSVPLEAATAARQIDRPVQVQWTRRQQFVHKYYRAAAVVNIRAGVKKDGTITAWDYHALGHGMRGSGFPYRTRTLRRARSAVSHVLPTGAWRGVAGPPNSYAKEAGVDELAAAIGADPFQFRLQNLRSSRSRQVLQRAISKFREKKTEPGDSQGVGVAFATDVGTEVAECVLLTVHNQSPPDVKIEKVVVAIDPGLAVNPEGIRLQVEGCVMMGLSSALYEEAEFGDGQFKTTGFDSYRLASFEDTPEIETHIVDTGLTEPQGVGEPPIFPITPAILNAYYDATGTRVRDLPLTHAT